MSLLLNDERLTKRAAEGDERAFAAIFDRYQEPLYRFCLSILGNPQDAQDALQNTMVKVLRGLPGERREIDLKPWLYRIAHNEAVELLRKRRPTSELDPELAGVGEGLAETAAQRQRLARLIADLGQLPERQRGALVMRELSDLDFEQIGGALGTSAATARQTVYEARLGLREMEAGREMSCLAVTKAVSDGDGRVLRRRDIRAHLRGCEECRSFREAIDTRERDLAALAPLPAFVAAAMLKGLVGGNGAGTAGIGLGGGAGIGGGAGLGGGAAVKSVAASSLLKGIATVAAVAAVGATAADRGGLIDFAPGGSGATRARRPAPCAPGRPRPRRRPRARARSKGAAGGAKTATGGDAAGARAAAAPPGAAARDPGAGGDRGGRRPARRDRRRPDPARAPPTPTHRLRGDAGLDRRHRRDPLAAGVSPIRRPPPRTARKPPPATRTPARKSAPKPKAATPRRRRSRPPRTLRIRKRPRGRANPKRRPANPKRPRANPKRRRSKRPPPPAKARKSGRSKRISR